MDQNAEDSFELALKHLERVRDSWDNPTDWPDLSIYGFYCLAACIVAAALHLSPSLESATPRKSSGQSERGSAPHR